MAVLLDEDDAPIVVDGQSRDGSAMSNDFPLGANAAGFFDLVDVDPKQAPVEGRDAGQ
jgi:hypothetical protein